MLFLTLPLTVHSQLLVSQVLTHSILLILPLILEILQIILLRTTSLPTFQRVRGDNSFYIYDVEQIKEYKQGEQDGIYYLTIIDSANKPSVAPFNGSDDFTFSQPIVNLYPQLDRDNPVSEILSLVLMHFPINWVRL